MILIIGLGNPGKKYENTRHNLGKMVIKNFAKTFDFPSFKLNKKLKSEITKNKIDSQEVVLALPVTYMNESGQAVKLLVSSVQYPVSGIWVVHDDLDLPLGKIKIAKNRSAAGHKGVQSIIDELGTQNFIRFRIGIKPQTYTDKTANLHRQNRKLRRTKIYVLQKFNKNEQKLLNQIIEKTIEAINFVLKDGLEKAMNKYN